MSAGVDGMTTLSPGMCASSASRLCECWLPDERPAPNWVRTVSAISRRAAGHERQLRGLVQQLVEADAEEVEVHDLDHRPHARHRRADAEADDRGLGDRRVADAVAEPVAQPAGEPEDVAAGADVDPGDEHPLVAGQLGFERGADRVHGAEHRRVRSAAAAAPAAPASGATTKSVKRVAGRARPGAGARVDGVVELGGDRRRQRLDRRSSSTPADRSRVAWTSERVARLPLVHLVGRPVALRVALVVAVPAVGRRLDDGRAAPGRAPRRRRRASRPRSRRRRCRRPRRSRRRTPRPVARASPRAARPRARTRRTRCSRRRRPPAAATRRRGSPPRGTRPAPPRRRRRTRPPRRRRAAAARRSRRRRRWAARRRRCRSRRRCRCVGSAMCIEPPRPRLVPASFAISSANIPSGSRPLARQWPWPRWVDVMTSAGRSGQHAPTAAASCPIDRCTKPGTSPSR